MTPVETPGGFAAGPHVRHEDEVGARWLTGPPVGGVGTLARHQVMTDASGALLDHDRER